MKRFITLTLRIIIFLLLSFLVYQKYTGKAIDIWQIGNSLGTVGDIIKQKFMPNTTQWSGSKSDISQDTQQWLLLHTTTEFSGAKADLQRNQDFSNNLITNTFILQQQVGKWGLFAARSGSEDHTNDQIIITFSGTTIVYPAFYNTSNAFALQQSGANTGEIYQATGIIILSGDKDYYLYYPASNGNGKLIGVILSLWSGIISASESTIPFLFYKNSYLFVKKESNNTNSALYAFQNGMLTTLATGEIGGISVEKDVATLHNRTTNEIIFLSLLDYSTRKILKPQRSDINYQSFLLTGDHIWVKYQDNLTGSTIYEKQVR